MWYIELNLIHLESLITMPSHIDSQFEESMQQHHSITHINQSCYPYATLDKVVKVGFTILSLHGNY